MLVKALILVVLATAGIGAFAFTPAAKQAIAFGSPFGAHESAQSDVTPAGNDACEGACSVSGTGATVTTVERTSTSTDAVPDAGPAVIDPQHSGHPLCIHTDVPHAARFIDDYTDSLGSHYHGWQPPAGPPFYVECYDAMQRGQ